MTEERDYFRSIFYVALVWIFTMIFHQVIYANLDVIAEYAPSLSFYANSGFLTLFLAVVGSIIAWIRTRKSGKQATQITKVESKNSDSTVSKPLVSKRAYLNNRINELSSVFPITLDEFNVSLSQGVVSYRRKRHLPREKRYRFEDLMTISDNEYNQMCFMRMNDGLSQSVYEDLLYIKGNDVPLFYELKDILHYFKNKYRLNDYLMDQIRKEIVSYNWQMAGRELNKVHETWR